MGSICHMIRNAFGARNKHLTTRLDNQLFCSSKKKLELGHCWHYISCSVMFNSATPWTAAHQASLSITNSRSLFKLRSIESVMPSNHLILCVPFSSCLQSFPASGTFLISQFFASGDQSIGASASASVLSVNIQD